MTKASQQEDLRALKLAVKIMGILLIVGTIALFIGIYIKYGNKSQKHSTTSEVVKTIPAIPAQIIAPAPPQEKACEFKSEADIELTGKIKYSIRNGNTLTIITEKKLKPAVINKVQEGNSLTLTAEAAVEAPEQIVIFDLCEGEVISRINVVTPE